MARLGLGLGREPGLPTLGAVIVCQLTRPAQVSVAMPGRFIWHGTAALAPRFGPWNVRGGSHVLPADYRLVTTSQPARTTKDRWSSYELLNPGGPSWCVWGPWCRRLSVRSHAAHAVCRCSRSQRLGGLRVRWRLRAHSAGSAALPPGGLRG